MACLLVGCGTPEMVPPPQPTALPPTRAQAASPVPATTTAIKTPATPATNQPSPTPSPQSTAAGLRLTSGGLTVIIEAPEDGATLTTSPVEFKGKAPAGTVISLNEINLVVGASGAFSAPIQLESGSNLVEFLASNARGDQVSYFFTVFFEP